MNLEMCLETDTLYSVLHYQKDQRARFLIFASVLRRVEGRPLPAADSEILPNKWLY